MMSLSVAHKASPFQLSWPHFVVALLFAIFSLLLTIRNNQFPATYHPDEPSKARQVIQGDYNFHHPLLLLDATRLIMLAAHVPPDENNVTIAGRWASAIFNSAAILALVLTAMLLGGWIAGLVAGSLLVANHQLFELAHYFKEDSSVLMGVSCFFLALLLYDRRPSASRAVALGAALGLAISGKYLGALVAPLAFGLIWWCRGKTRPVRDTALCLAITLAVFAIINLPALLHPEKFADGFGREMDFAVSGHRGISRDVPHGVYWKVFLDSTMPVRWAPVVGLLLLAYYSSLILRRKEARASEWMLALYPIAFAVLLSFFPKTHHRYFLPATGLLLTLAALGAATLPGLIWRQRPVFGPVGKIAVVAGVLAVALAAQLPTFLNYHLGFRRDGRSAMADYLRQNVPAGEIIVQDKRVDLDALQLPYDFRGRFFAAEFESIKKLRAMGVRYVAVAEGDYGRYFGPNMKPSREIAKNYRAYRRFYRQLFTRGKKVFECPAGTVQYLQPHLVLYRLPGR